MNHDAIRALYPNVVTIDDKAGAMDKDGKPVAVNMSDVNNWVDPEAYKYKRQQEYPPMADYLDGIVKGDDIQIQKYIDDCLAVKAKYPKGDE